MRGGSIEGNRAAARKRLGDYYVRISDVGSETEPAHRETSRDEVAGVRLSHPGKVLFPAQGLTKSDLATYYEAVSERMLPQISDRPLSLVRCPQGRDGKCFFQKHDQGGFPAAMKTMAITEASGERARYFYVDRLAGLIAGVQVGVLEFHLWGCRRDRLEYPDRLVFDLDPDQAVDFADVSRAATDVRDRLETLGLNSWAMVTGGKGIHVIVPLARRHGWDEVKGFARGFAQLLSRKNQIAFSPRPARRAEPAASSSIGCATIAAPPRYAPIPPVREQVRRSPCQSDGMS